MEEVVFQGQYLDGVSANAYSVEVSFEDGNLIIQDDRFGKTVPVSALEVSDRLGRLPRTLKLPDGSAVILPDSQSLSRHLREGTSYLRQLESNALYAAMGLVLLVACAWGFYVVLLPQLSDALAGAISIEMEEKLSNQTLESMDAGKVWKSSSLSQKQQSTIRSQLGSQLGSVAMANVKLQFRESAVLGANAFALPGSEIVITDKLVEILSGDELAAVVAHELGHLHHKHNSRMMVRDIGLTGVLGLLIGFRGANDSLLGAAQALGQSKYSREFEGEADAYSTTLMRSANLSPCLLASSLLKLEAVSKGAPGSHASWFASHPPTQQRVSQIGLACEGT